MIQKILGCPKRPVLSFKPFLINLCVTGIAGALVAAPAIVQAAEPSPVVKQLLTQSAMYEKNGTLAPTDTRIRFGDGAFHMDQARYQAELSAKLGGKAPITYRYKNHHLGFTPIGVYWSGASTDERKPVGKNGINAVKGRLALAADELDGQPGAQSTGKAVVYQSAYGPGLDLSVLTENLAFRKIAKFDSRKSLGTVAEGAEFLDLRFELDADADTYFKGKFGSSDLRVWDKTDKVGSKDEAIEFGLGDERSYIKPAYAWDSDGKKIPLALEFSREADRLVLTKRIPVAWVKEATFPIYADATIAFATAAVFGAMTIGETAVTALDATHVVIAYIDGMNGMGIVGLITGTTLTFPSAAVNYNWTTHSDISISTLDSTHVIIAYSNTSGSSGAAIVGLIAGTVISFPSGAVDFMGVTAAGPLSVAATDATHAVIAYQDTNNSNHGTGRVASIAGTVISFPSADVVFEAADTSQITVTALDATHVAIVYADNGNSGRGTATVGLIAGTVISYPSGAVVFEAAGASNITAAALDSTHVAIGYSDPANSNRGTAIVGLVTGTTFSFPSAAAVFEAGGMAVSAAAARLDATHAIFAYQDSTNANYGTAIIGDIAGTDITFPCSAAVFEAATTNNVSVTVIDGTHLVTAYRDTGNSDYGTAIVGTVSFPAGNGSVCSSGCECTSTFCVDGRCCNNACAGGTTDCQACSIAAGAPANGTCATASPATICRPASGACDKNDNCDGISTTCGGDGRQPDGVPCNNDSSTCNGVNKCSGGFCYPTDPPIECTDFNECTTDTCVDPAGTCTHLDLTDGTPCSGGVCAAGSCSVTVTDAGVDGAPVADATVDTTPAVDTAVDTVVVTPPVADATVDTVITPPVADATADTVITPPVADATVDTVITPPVADATADTTVKTDTVSPALDASALDAATLDATTVVDGKTTTDGESVVDTIDPVTTDGASTDNGNTKTNDGGGSDGTGGTGGSDGDGCDCRAGGDANPLPASTLWSLLLLGWIVSRRRRRR